MYGADIPTSFPSAFSERVWYVPDIAMLKSTATLLAVYAYASGIVGGCVYVRT